MTRLSCPDHGPLVWNETTEESRMVGTLSFEREEVAFIQHWICPEDGCREYRRVKA